MSETRFRINVHSENEMESAQGARTLADHLAEIRDVREAKREKGSSNTMDLGSVIAVVISSGATAAIAQGIADWIRRTRGVHLVIEVHGKDANSKSIKAELSQIDPESALRVTEMIVRG